MPCRLQVCRICLREGGRLESREPNTYRGDTGTKRMLSQSDTTTRLNRSISDASWGMFLNMLENKCQETGCNLIKVEKDYPSTKLCSYCGYINKDVTLSMRTITCPRCRNTYDRDGNAARNLYNRRWLNVENSWAVGTIVR